MEDLILKNYLILFNDKSHTYFHSACGTFSSIDITLCSPMNECLTTLQHEKQIGYWASEKGKLMKWLYN